MIIWIFVGIGGQKLLKERAVENLESTANQQTWAVANKVDALMERLRDLSANALIINAFLDPLSVEYFLNPFFNSLRFGDYQSLTIVMTDFNGRVVATNRQRYVSERMQDMKHWHDAVVDGKEVLTVIDNALVAAVPIQVGSLSEGGLLITMSPDDTAKLLSSEQEGGQVWLKTENGNVLFGPDDAENQSAWQDMIFSDNATLPKFPSLILNSAVAADEQDHFVSLLHSFLLIAFLFDLAALVFGIYMAASLVANPLNKLVTKIRSLQQLSDPDARLEPDGPYELRNLAQAFNQAAERQAKLMARTEKALEKEKEANELQRKFVTLVSHEFRTPLAVIDGNAHRILSKVDTVPRERIGKGLEKCRSSVRRLIGVMESFLSSSRLEAGTIKFDPSPCRIGDVLTEVVDNQREISTDYQIDMDADSIPTTIYADGSLLHQIFSNLLSNAVKYSPEKKNIIVKGYEDDGFAIVSFHDQGVGIPETELEKLFSRFFRASTSTGIAGTGIGLHLIKSLVEMHCGVITVDSVQGEGSTFTVKFPIEKPTTMDMLAA